MLLGVILSVITVCATYWYLTSSYGYWRKRGIPYAEPTCFVGNLGPFLLFRKHLGEIHSDIYNSFKDYLYVGIYKVRQPALLIRDPELIKKVLIKDFNYFHDNDMEVDEEADPIVARNPFILRGHRWKVVRTQVTSAITSGRIKNMFYLIKNVSKNLIDYLSDDSIALCKDGIEAKDLTARFTTDNVAICGFGLEGKSFTNETADFRTMGQRVLKPTFWNAIKMMIIILFPELKKFFRISFVPKDVADWFTATVKDTMKYREDNGIVRNDYLDIMMSLRTKEGEYEFTDLDVVAQSMTLYIDGFETSSVAIAHALYEIASDPQVQKRLQEEIDRTLEKHGGEMTYEAVHEMEYLDMVFSESLRLHPPGLSLTKVCSQTYTLPAPKGAGPDLRVEVGTPVVIPVLALHMDPEYFPKPEEFNPERFSADNKALIAKGTYLPFGDGPRQCLGMRFAITQSKSAIVAILSNFNVRVNPATKLPMIIDPQYIIKYPKHGLYLNFHKRSK